MNLPEESRFVRKIAPMKDWNWDKEIQSQILWQLDRISCQLTNLFRKRGTKKVKPQKQMQPDYVERAKTELRRKKNKGRNFQEDELEEMHKFWKNRNPEAKFLGEKDEQD